MLPRPGSPLHCFLVEVGTEIGGVAVIGGALLQLYYENNKVS